MASPASTSAPLSLSFLLPPYPYLVIRRLPAPRPRRLALALAPARPGAALLSGLGDTQEEQDDDYEEEEEEEEEEEMVEVGYVSGAHGVRGDVLVAPRTDFPELRFAAPGKRWLRARAAGRQQVREFELVRGRAHTGKKSWIVSFEGIDTLDEARQIVGSDILVKVGDRPNMEEGEIYSLDLVGMRVIVKDIGKLVGTVAQVFNFGAGDLLQVSIASAEDTNLQPKSENLDPTSAGEHVWIPFAEDIVPDIDMESRQMWITPPKGLLELNSRSDKRSKKERHAMEWKEKKKLQRRIIAAKKILSEMDQVHVLEGLVSGDKVQKASLAEQIGSTNFQLFRIALHSVSKQVDSSSKNVLANSSPSRKKLMRIPYKILTNHAEKEEHVFSNELNKGFEILRKSKAATILVINGPEFDSVDAEFQTLLNSYRELTKDDENCVSLPFIIVSPADHVDSIRSCLVENEYFGLDTQKVWVLEEMELPVMSISSKKILLKSPSEILQKPAGSGTIFSLLSSSKILDNLNICSLSNRPIIGHPLLFGAVSSHGADVGIKLCEGSNKTEDGFDFILSMNHLNKLCRDGSKLRFFAQPEQHIHIEQVDGEWVTIKPEAPNSHRLRTDFTGVWNSCSPDKLCYMEIVES